MPPCSPKDTGGGQGVVLGVFGAMESRCLNLVQSAGIVKHHGFCGFLIPLTLHGQWDIFRAVVNGI